MTKACTGEGEADADGLAEGVVGVEVGLREDDRLGEVLAENATVAVGDVDAEKALPGEAVAVGVRLLGGDGDRVVMVEGVVDAKDDAVGVGVIADADGEGVVEEVTVGEADTEGETTEVEGEKEGVGETADADGERVGERDAVTETDTDGSAEAVGEADREVEIVVVVDGEAERDGDDLVGDDEGDDDVESKLDAVADGVSEDDMVIKGDEDVDGVPEAERVGEADGTPD
jgi:hypothetical protein